MRKLLALLLVLFVLSISSCGQQQTPTPEKNVLPPARVAELEALIRDLGSRINKGTADIEALKVTISPEEMIMGERWEGAVFIKENNISVGEDANAFWGVTAEDTLVTPSPRYVEYARLRDEALFLFTERNDLEKQLPPTPVRPTPDIKPILWKEQVVQIVQKYLRSLTEAEANDLGVGQEWELLQDDWPIRWKAVFYPAERRWIVECFEAFILVDDVSGAIDIVPGYAGGNDFAHEVEP